MENLSQASKQVLYICMVTLSRLLIQYVGYLFLVSHSLVFTSVSLDLPRQLPVLRCLIC